MATGKIKAPTTLQRCFSSTRFVEFIKLSSALIWSIMSMLLIAPIPDELLITDPKYGLNISIAFAIGIAGYYVLWPVTSIMFLPLIRLRGRINGAPFAIGQNVVLVCDQHFGCKGRVCEIFNDRGLLRVELETTSVRADDDLFSFTDVVLIEQQEPFSNDDTSTGSKL